MTKMTKILLSVAFVLSCSHLCSAAESTVNAKLTAEQIEFVKKHAPNLIQPKCNFSVDGAVPLDYRNPGDFRVCENDPSKSGNEDKLNALKKKTVVYFIYQELNGFVLVNYMFYRTWSAGFGWTRGVGSHVNDTESVYELFKKKNLGSSYEKPLATMEPELVAIVTNWHGDSVKAVASRNYIPNIGAPTDEVIAGLNSMTKYIGEWGSTVFSFSPGDSERPLIFSEFSRHDLYPVYDVSVASEALNKPETYIFSEASSLTTTNAASPEFMFQKATHVPYDLVDLSDIVLDPAKDQNEGTSRNVLTKADVMLAPNTGLNYTNGKSDWDGKDILGNVIVPRSDVNGDLLAGKGESNEANLSYNWGVTNAKIKSPKNKKSGDAIGLPRTDGAFPHKWVENGTTGLVKNADELDIVRAPFMKVRQ
ncbi:MAG: hypothetical protein JWQ35_2770 [Bacteriovoracaceae bacterium]|nr:hypothetical protein [Bacteriovoracaceae bacterium]